jgi:hypothetical protein
MFSNFVGFYSRTHWDLATAFLCGIARIFFCAAIHADRPWDPPYNSYRLTVFPEIEWAGGRDADPSHHLHPILTMFHCFFCCPGGCNFLLTIYNEL